jgi:hypothetical protein
MKSEAPSPDSRHYAYVGPRAIAERCRGASGIRIASSEDMRRWIAHTGQKADDVGEITATFVIDLTGTLRLADRHSEHVACAGGEDVLSAGEMTFAISDKEVLVVRVTNQSTGYCPEPESWPAVVAALARAGLTAPEGFTPAFVFRRCVRCGETSIVKDGWFVCGTCDAALPGVWNFDAR